MKLRSKLGILLLALGVVVITAGGVFTYLQLESFFMQRILNELEMQAKSIEFVLRTFVEPSVYSYKELQSLSLTAGIRLTLIASDGTVLFESERPQDGLSMLENHLTRPEVQEALQKGTGKIQRHSVTVNAEMLYLAERLSEAFPATGPFAKTAVLRVGVPLTEVTSALDELKSKVVFAGISILLFVIVLSIFLSKRITRPIAAMASVAEKIRGGNLDHRIPIISRDEIGKLGETLNSMIDKLNEDIVQLRKLERVRSQFLGNVSHELRTPLFALHSAIETLLNGAIDDPVVNRDFLEKALHNTQRLDELLTDLIEISRIESGEMKMSFRYFELHEFVRETVEAMQHEANKKGITISYQKMPSSFNVLGDKERLRQVMENLLSNAIKYTQPGGNVMVSAENVTGSVRIAVTDTGSGIPPEHIPRIFERFYRVDKDRSREVGGTGLGLAIVKHIVEAHGSKVEVHSEVGKGSVFSFALKR
jgi:two-component system phosphate regulon sensor histidine kinase PhoR